ncbi:uracil-DNA glycosylase [Corynebacterium mendelii]|uniref:Uracil-DNA glycosylase n=1 Tax=Corynebacterium mendelii TaxID=2765362 RepID=A0A939IU63_9CORY|nr:uracil-DNA glycosylase [Corynebacterium mendelii]MBN9644599.1 uracil-DNA glycosylase [Corynebacterium mendelii]
MSTTHTADLPVHDSWKPVLEPVAGTIARLGDFLRAENAAGRGYLPAGSDVLKAFTYPFDDVRVLIVGQDPYPTPGHAMGLAFSVAPDVRPLPRSLVNIYRELSDDLGIGTPEHGDLSGWCDKGVALFNRVLSVSPGKPASHSGQGWEEVTECAIRALAGRDRPLVAVLWGSKAQATRKFMPDIPAVCSPHPSPLSAHRGFFGSKPFSRTNRLLEQMGSRPIDWRL